MLNCEISFFQKKEPPPKTTSLNSYFSRNTFIRRKTGLLLQTLFFPPTFCTVISVQPVSPMSISDPAELYWPLFANFENVNITPDQVYFMG